MANTITLQASMAVSGSDGAISGSASNSISQSGSKRMADVQNIGTSFEVLSIVDLTVGYLFVKNLDATNYVQITSDGASGAKIFAKLRAGEACLLPADSSATYGARANTSACDVLIVVCDL